MKLDIYYTALKTYDSDNKNGFSWEEYKKFSEINHLKELVSLDGILNGLAFIPDLDASEEWKYMVTENGMVMFFFNNLEYVLSKVNHLEFFNLLAVIKEPTKEKADLSTTYDFIGYDLIGIGGDVSALTNCGGFDETFLPNDLNAYGLISEYDKAKKILKELPINNPEEQHADCNLYEVWRHKIIGRKTN
ncbi:hypothetical protein [Lacinutrix jangbogonensis]|uniref:hypothetical protein n=1 Tax=Lacinutrix jangbogonensis TaxID=1469557 RepID=UPI00053D1FBB|nr:hypothetical protein [Lacinutrix jangbogonensis]